MDFILRYRGPLPASSSVKIKEDIRRYLAPQLRELCRRDVRFQPALSIDLPNATLTGRTAEPERDAEGKIKSYFFKVTLQPEKQPYEFVPIVSRIQDRYVSLDIVWLRQEKPGEILKREGGDLDNRLKSHSLTRCGYPSTSTRFTGQTHSMTSSVVTASWRMTPSSTG